MHRSSFLLVSGLLVSGLPVQAADIPASAPSVADAETVVVTATRTPTPLVDTGSSLTVITGDDIAAHQFESLPDVLNAVPGLNIVQTGGPGGQTSVFLRGTDSNHAKVLVDGLDVSDASSPNDAFDFGEFPAQDIAQVEVLRGPQSGLYGSDAIGGVINVITQGGAGPARFTARIDGGSFGTFNQSGGVSGSEGPFHYAAHIQHDHVSAAPVTPGDILAPGEARIDDRDDNLTASTKLGYDVTGSFDLGLVARYTGSRLGFTGDNFANYPSTPDTTQSTQHFLQYATRATAHLSLFDGRFEQTVGLGYVTDRTTVVGPESGASRDEGDRLKLDWQGNVRLAPGALLILGVEHQSDELRQPVTASNTIDGGFAELQSDLGGGFFNSVSVRYDDNARFGGVVTWHLAPTYTVEATGTRIKASAGTGFKAPSLSDLFVNYPAYGFFGNPNLKPEASFGYDAGFEQPLWNDSFRFGATWYRIHLRDLIEATFTSYANIDEARTEGVEAFIAWAPLPTLSFRADYTFTQADDLTAAMELVRRPKHKGSLDAMWQATPQLSVDASVVLVGDWLDYARDSLTYQTHAPGYVTADIAARYAIDANWSVFVKGSNLFDAHYQVPLGFLHEGRGVFAGAEARM